MANVVTTVRANIAKETTPKIYNLSMPTSGTEYSQALTNSTKSIMIRMRVKATCKVAFVSGDTNLLYVTVNPGAVFFKENLDLSGATIYLQSDINGQVAEILEWT